MIRLASLRANNFKQLKEISLRFPERGSILVEGRNEAGKSTLFEAVFFALFGKPLLAETKLEDLCAYEATEAIVELVLMVEGRRIDVQRKLKRKGAQQARLRVTSPDGSVDEVSATSAVNRRLVEELKLDPDAFLNSCFVEQKKLEKLEGMSLGDRQKSLGKLLNLERLDQQADELKVRVEDRSRVEHLKRRAELAAVEAELPVVARAGQQVRRRLAVADARAGLVRLGQCRTEAESARAEAAALEQPIADLEARLARAQALHRALADVETAAACVRTVADQQAAIVAARTEQQELEQVEAETLPALVVRRRRLAVLRNRWTRIAGLEALKGADETEAARVGRLLEEAAARSRRARELDAEISRRGASAAEDADAAERLGSQVAALDARQALEDWLSAFRAHTGLERVERQTEMAQRTADDAAGEKAGAEAEAATLSRQSQRLLSFVWVALAALLAIVVAAFAVREPFVLLAALVPAGALLFLVPRRRSAATQACEATARAQGAGAAAGEARSALLRLEGQRAAAEGTEGASAGRLKAAVARLQALGQQTPVSLEDGEAALASLPEVDGADSPDELRQALSRVRTEAAAAGGQLAALRSQLDALQREVTSAGTDALEASRTRAVGRAARLGGVVLPRQIERATALARALGVGDAASADEGRTLSLRAESGADSDYRAARARLDGRPALEQRLAEAGRRIESEQSRLAGLRERIAAAWRDNPLETAKDVADVRTGVQAEMAAQDGEGARRSLEDHNRRRGQAQASSAAADREAQTVETGVRDALRKLTLADDTPLSEASLTHAIPEWEQTADDDRTTLEVEFESLKDRFGQLTGSKSTLVSALGGAVPADLRTAELELEEMESVRRDIAVRERAIRILNQARSSIMQKVMPYTMAHMRRILPALTMDRYHDAQLTEDYKITVWDERAGGWKSKNIFSGGTRDQFSLALRLAFAIATLPQERGSAPSFIFLDEPLSSFDAERSAALLYLLTQGEVAEAFDQILVISHTNSPAADNFQFRVRLDGGRIGEPTSEELLLTEPATLELLAPEPVSDSGE